MEYTHEQIRQSLIDLMVGMRPLISGRECIDYLNSLEEDLKESRQLYAECKRENESLRSQCKDWIEGVPYKEAKKEINNLKQMRDDDTIRLNNVTTKLINTKAKLERYETALKQYAEGHYDRNAHIFVGPQIAQDVLGIKE